MSQSRLGSVVEITCNYILGFVIAWAASLLFFRVSGIHASVADSFWMTVFMTVVSMCRSYVVRRLFNHLHQKGVLK